jgi:hypothetical protein
MFSFTHKSPCFLTYFQHITQFIKAIRLEGRKEGRKEREGEKERKERGEEKERK